MAQKQMAQKKPAIIVISSHVVRGTVGNRAAAFALEVLGFPVWIVPTVTLPWHPGHGLTDRIVPPDAAFDHLMDDLAEAPWLSEVGAVLSGYLGSVAQVGAVARLVDAVKTRTPNALYALDPVLGDDERLYVPEEQAAAILTHLMPRADLITPNPFEMGWLAKRETPDTVEALRQAALSLNVDTVLATSAPAMMAGLIGNLLIHNGKAHLAEHRLAKGPPNGLGDLAAALMLGHLLAAGDGVTALRKTSASLYEVMMIAAKAGSDQLLLEASITSLVNPRTPVDARQLVSMKR